MFRRSRSQGDEPVANKLSGAAEPNVLKVTRPGGSGEDDATEWTWTADGMTPAQPDETNLDADLEPGEETGPEDMTRSLSPEELQAELEREAEEFGLTGDNPTALYGPNGEDVASLLDSLPTIDDALAEKIADAYEAIPAAERKVARSVIGRRHRGGQHDYELDMAERAVADWLSSLKFFDPGDAELYAVVADAATDAVDALVLEDELADADFATLYGAWSEVMDTDDDTVEDAGAESEAGSEDREPAAETGADEVEIGPLGPNTDLLATFLDRLAGLESVQIVALVERWRKQPKEDLKVAHRALQDLADEDKTWREQMRLAQEEVFAWMEGRTTAYMEHFATARQDAQLRESAGPVVADAVAALAMADILEDEDADVLYAPWAEVVGEPELPVYEDDEPEDEPDDASEDEV